MFAEINVSSFEKKKFAALISAVRGLANYLGTNELSLRVFIFAILRRSRISLNKFLSKINEFTVMNV